MFLKNLITHFALLAYVIVNLREDYNTFRYWVKDDNSRHLREKIALIFHKCQLQRKVNNSEKNLRTIGSLNANTVNCHL